MALPTPSERNRKALAFSPSSRARVHGKRHALFLVSLLPIMLVSGVLANWVFLAQPAFAAPAGSVSTPGNNTFQQFLQEGQKSKASHGAPVLPPDKVQGKLPKPQTPPSSAEPPTMKALTLPLTSTQTNAALATAAGVQPQDLKGSDGRLEVLVPAGALDISHAVTSQGKAPTGTLTLHVLHLHGNFVGTFHLLGEYQFQILDAAGQQVQGVVLRLPLTVIYHYQPSEIQRLQLDPDQLFMTWPLVPSSTGTPSATRTSPIAKQATTASGQPLSRAIPMINDPRHHTLSAQVRGALVSPLVTSTGTSFGDDQSPPKPNFASVQGNSGNLGYSYPVQLAPGPDGFIPQLQFTYSSAVPDGQHTSVQPASNEGEGWSIGLGSISMSKLNGTTYYSISGIDGVSDLLIPIPGQSGFYETQHLSHLRIQQFTSPITNQPCFHVWNTSGEDDEIGCTADSLQYYTNSAGRTNYRWDMDLTIAANQGPGATQKQIQTHYQQDVVTSNGLTSIRDASIGQILYGYDFQGSFTTMGTVDFLYRAPYTSASSNGIGEKFATAYGTNYQCGTPPANTTMRCDDPITFNNATAGTIAPPTVMATMMLQKVETFVGDDSSATHLDASYALDYHTVHFATCFDSLTQIQMYCAGELTLTSITPTAYLQGNAHALKPVTFGYTAPAENFYLDTTQKNLQSATYNVQMFLPYLNAYYDGATGVGEKITYATAWNNTHGTPAASNGDDRHDPLYCDSHSDCTGAYANAEDRAWTVQVVTQIQNEGADSSVLAGAMTTYQYQLAITGTACPAAGSDTDCVGDTWLPPSDTNWLDFYDGQFQGFASVLITSPAGDLTVQHYDSNDGWGAATTDPVEYLSGNLLDEEVYSGNSASGPLLEQTINTYAGENGKSPISCDTSVTSTYVPCEMVLLKTQQSLDSGVTGSLPDPALFVRESDYTYDDYNPSASGTGLQTGSGHYHNLTQEQVFQQNTYGSTGACQLGCPPALVLTKKWAYATDDQTVNGWTYYTVDKVAESEIDDPSGHIWECMTTKYDEGEPSGVPSPSTGWPTTVNTYGSADCASRTNPLTTTYTGYDQFGNQLTTVDGVGAAQSALYSSQGCVLTFGGVQAGPSMMSPAWTMGDYTTCTQYDVLTLLPVSQSNAFRQTLATSYDPTQQDLPISKTDANGQTTTASYSYDGSGNLTVQVKQPQEAGSYTSQSTQFSGCATTLPASTALPCLEEEQNTALYSSAISRTFYDGQGRKVETRTPGPTPGDDTVVMTEYNDQNHTVWQSEPFQVADGSGYLDPTGVKDVNGNTPAGTTTFSDALGRAIAVQDPNIGSTQEPGLACSATLTGTYTSCMNYALQRVGLFGTGAGTTYDQATRIDPDGHVAQTLADPLGHTAYSQTTSGVFGGTLTLAKVTSIAYNVLDKPTSVVVTDKQPQSGQSSTSVATTMSYDDLGRLLTMNDPDQGTFSYSYDADGQVLSAVQTSGSNSRTLGYNYDLLGRLGCEQTAAPTINATGACSAGSPLVQNTYDTTELGTQGGTDFPIGQLTQSVATTSYPDGTSATVTEQAQHDPRGRTITTQVQLGLPAGWGNLSLPAYQASLLYNDANQVTTTSTNGSGGYTFTNVYDPTTGVLQGLSNNGNSTANLAQLSYNEFAQLGSMTLLNGASSSPTSIASETFNYDANLRPLSLTATWLPGSGNSGQILGQSRSFDNASNVTSVNTTFTAVPGQSGSGGTETQNFCYDEQNRMIWSGNSGTQPGAGNGTCGSGTLGNTISGAGYTAPFTYTNLGQIWQGPVNGQGSSQQDLYCNSQPHQLSGIYPLGTTCANMGSATASYRAGYDPWGNITSRTDNTTTTTLSYDQLNRLVESNVGSNQEFYVYDASGQRVLKRSTSGGTTTLTAYAFGLQELTYTGSGVLSNQVDYYSLAGHLIGATNGTATTYDLTDALGSVLMSLSSSAVLGEQAYGPYGNQRYSAGTMGTDKGYTGQFHDSVTGLDYYNARYYDPVIGQFLSPDSVQGNAQGMSPYAYVAENPETMTDPTGQRQACPDQNCGGGMNGTGTPDGSGNQPTAGAPDSDPGSGGCDKGMHLTNNGCASDTSGCLFGMQLGRGGCVYTNNGDCTGLTVVGCKQYKQELGIKRAQALARSIAVRFILESALLMMIEAFLPQLAAGFMSLATWFGALSAILLWNPVAAGVAWAASIALSLLSGFAAGSEITVAIGAAADFSLGTMFALQATDDNPADWSSAALDSFSARVNGLAGAARAAITVVGLLKGGSGPLLKLLGSKAFGFALSYSLGVASLTSLNGDIAQMRADVSA